MLALALLVSPEAAVGRSHGGGAARRDTHPPSRPAGLTASPAGASRIDLRWTASTDNVGVAGYLIERCQGSGCRAFTQTAETSGTGASYGDTGLAAGTSYGYRVRAIDAAGNLSGYSNVARAATPTGGTSTPDLVAAYGFNEGSGTKASDASGNGNHGTLANATWAAGGKFGKALAFNGTSALVTVPSSASLRLTTAMTLEAWVKPSPGAAAWRDVIYKGNDDYFLEASSFNGGLPGGGGTLGGLDVVAYGTGPLPANTWTHIAVTYDGTVVRFYQNGVEMGAGLRTGGIATSATPLQIGGDTLYGQYFQGLIDEVRVYKVARSAAQIQVDSSTPIAPATGDTEPPTAPGNLTATGTSLSQITLHWTPATDDVGVTGYRVERCPGSSCTTFVEVGSTVGSGTTAVDSGLAPGTTYSYRVRASDAAGNLGPYSNVARGTPALTVTPRVAVLTFSQTQQFTAGASGMIWAVDGVTGGSTAAGRITPDGLYTPPGSVGRHTVTATTADRLQSASATVHVTNYPGTFTHHNDNARTGQNPGETVLTPANVRPATFGKLFSYTLDGNAYASPLYVANVAIPGRGVKNVVYVATEHDSVWAFDADGIEGTALWHRSFIDPASGVTTVPSSDTYEAGDIFPEIGITGTPVIDPASGTLYVVAKTKEVSGGTVRYAQRLHALDIATGAETRGGPVLIQASVPGIGSGSQGGRVAFDPLRENQRPALLLSRGVVYIGYGSHGDQGAYHGWVLGYDATTLRQVMAFNTTPNGFGGGIWQGGGGLAADSSGTIYFGTANGTFDVNVGGTSYGDSFVKLHPSGAVLDFFTPHDQVTLSAGNLDLGSGGLVLLPRSVGGHRDLLVEASKDGTIYLVDRNAMGHYNPNNDSQIVQSLVNVFSGGTGNFSTAVYFDGTVYFAPINDAIKAFRVSNARLSIGPTSQTPETYGFPGGAVSISAKGTSNGILWAVQRVGSSVGVLRAYDAGDLTSELYSSDRSPADALDVAAKFSVPVVANGKVFVGSLTQLSVYGLLP
jgi:hypothetical protein